MHFVPNKPVQVRVEILRQNTKGLVRLTERRGGPPGNR